MMKFVLRSVQNGCRFGVLSETCPKIEMESPLCMLYNRAGCVPYITHDLFEKISGLPSVMQMPSNLLLEHSDTVRDFGAGIKKFTAMENFVVYFHPQDSACAVPKGYNDSRGISIWGQGGKKKLDAEQYMDVVDAFQPDWFQALADSDTDQDSTKKRIRRSVERTLEYLDHCIKRKEQSDCLKNAAIIGVLEGGHSITDRIASAKETAKRPVAGFSIEGFHNFGPDTEAFRISEIEELLRVTILELPEDKPRFLPGIYNPLEIIKAVKLGCDIFESTYPYIVTERGCAFVFDLDTWENRKPDDPPNTASFEVSLKNQMFQNSFVPVLKGCTCYACQNFTAAYIYHLVNTSELLGSLLLMIHNFHHYFRFFEVLRIAIAANKIIEFEEHFERINSQPKEANSEDTASS